MFKKIMIGLVAVLLIMQLFQPAKNKAEALSENDISKTYALPVGVHDILTQKCYDCHSNNTTYPWYTSIQPIGWWMASHIKEGKEHLNFSEFKTYPAKRANHKLEEVSEEITKGHMPLESYLWIHTEAKVTAEEVQAINAWITSLGIAVK
jgi:hypothetical protein